MIAKIEQLLQEVEAMKAANAEELEALRIKYLSKKGAINELMADFRNVPAEQKKEVGMKLNELKNKAQEKIAALKEQFESQNTGCDNLDLTRSAYPIKLGTRHPLSIVKNEIIDIFARMGFNIADGPEVEDDWHVFSSMNFAEDHPARDMQDTFFIENNEGNVRHPAHTHVERTKPRDGNNTTAHPRHLSGTCIPQRSHQLPCTRFLPSGRSPVRRQERIVHRPEAGAVALRSGNVR